MLSRKITKAFSRSYSCVHGRNRRHRWFLRARSTPLRPDADLAGQAPGPADVANLAAAAGSDAARAEISPFVLGAGTGAPSSAGWEIIDVRLHFSNKYKL